ncbi:MAG: LPS assembly lipoprotein LptE [Gammaproteobacteria bacterium]
MIKSIRVYALLAAGLLLIQSCGFHLRGAGTDPANVQAVYLHGTGADRIQRILQQQLGEAVKTNRSAAAYEIIVSNENFRQNVISVSAVTGKVEEFNINYSCLLNIARIDSDAAELINNQRISLSKDYTFDEDAVLSKFEEQRTIEKDLVAEAARNIIRRFNAVAN